MTAEMEDFLKAEVDNGRFALQLLLNFIGYIRLVPADVGLFVHAKLRFARDAADIGSAHKRLCPSPSFV